MLGDSEGDKLSEILGLIDKLKLGDNEGEMLSLGDTDGLILSLRLGDKL